MLNIKKRRIVAFSVVTSVTTLLISGAVFAGNGDISVATSGVSAAIESFINNSEDSDNAHINTAGISVALNDYYVNEKSTEVIVASKEDIESILMLKPESETKKEEPKKEENKNEAKKEDKNVSYAGYKKLGVANVTNYLNVREEPSMTGKILGKLPMNAGCEILDEVNGWYKIESGNVSGYVSSEYLLTGQKALKRAKKAISTYATVTCDQLKVRQEPNTNCAVLSRVAKDEKLEVVEVLDGWVKININNNIGYVSAEFVNVHDSLPQGLTIKELSYGGDVSNKVVELIEYAKQFLGNPYVYGGTSLTNGTDCSGFTMRIFEHFGYSLNRSSGSQSYNGTPVSLSEIKPGDLLFYSYGSSIGHVAIYIGNGQIIHAGTERTGICIGNAYYQTPCCARRIIY
ncbi:MAG: NlpC/P60 family protein [Lachnospiraceae bacterium]|nr:NlpC/P60 family protein [Lachnospiraceae bacterium]MBQ4068437.1 C40 family peptidase [Lachnospiraceae bacterium]